MTAKRTSPGALKPVVGALLLAFGLFLLFASLDELVAHIGNAAGASAQAVGTLFAVGLAALHALQAYMFDQARFLSGFEQMLVSFWPLILVIIGAVLLQDAFKGHVAACEVAFGSSVEGDRP